MKQEFRVDLTPKTHKQEHLNKILATIIVLLTEENNKKKEQGLTKNPTQE